MPSLYTCRVNFDSCAEQSSLVLARKAVQGKIGPHRSDSGLRANLHKLNSASQLLWEGRVVSLLDEPKMQVIGAQPGAIHAKNKL
jgi:hypothetical protein